MYDQKLISTRYRAVAFMSGYFDAYEAMMEYPTLEHVPIKYIENVKKFFKKSNIAITCVYENNSEHKKCKKSHAEFFTVSASKKEKPMKKFITI